MSIEEELASRNTNIHIRRYNVRKTKKYQKQMQTMMIDDRKDRTKSIHTNDNTQDNTNLNANTYNFNDIKQK